MSKQADLHDALSRALHTEELSLEHGTIIISPEVTKQVSNALSAAALTSVASHAPGIESARRGPERSAHSTTRP